MRAAFTGGVTGGHIYPAVAVAEALRQAEPGVQLLFIGGREGMEARIVPEAGIRFSGVTTGRIRRLVSPSTLPALLAIWRGIREAKAALRQFAPGVVVGTGGYVATGAIYAAHRLGIPTIILEPNAVSGRMNRCIARWATRVCVAYEANRGDFPPDRTVVTGTPIRPGIVSGSPREEARAALGLAEDSFVVLALGGSQGAQALNIIVMQAAGQLPAGVCVLHQTGTKHFESVVATAGRIGLISARYEPRAFFDSTEMPLAYRAADLVVSRCGSTVAEITACGLPSVLVPLPGAYADHQTANARSVEVAGAGLLLPQTTLTGTELARQIMELRQRPEQLEAMAAASRRLGRPGAAAHVAQIARELALPTEACS